VHHDPLAGLDDRADDAYGGRELSLHRRREVRHGNVALRQGVANETAWRMAARVQIDQPPNTEMLQPRQRAMAAASCVPEFPRHMILLSRIFNFTSPSEAAMDLGDITQLVLVATTALVLGRVGLALARLVEHRALRPSALTPESEDRVRYLEGECALLRQEVTELQERQDFTERALLHDTARPRESALAPVQERVLTPR
jgi:hypothetical protein